MNCDACKSEELLVIKVSKYAKPVVMTGYVLCAVALLAAIVTGVYMWQAASTQGGDPTARAIENGVARLQQIAAVTPEMIKDFQDDGQISETLLSKLGPDDRVDVDKVLNDYRTGALAIPTTSDSGWIFWTIMLVVCGGVFVVGVAMAWRTEQLKCAKCGAINKVAGV